MNVLIVDDAPANLRLLRAQLEPEGHTIFEAGDGVEALALLEHQSVDAIISDILMPRMDGYRLCYEVRCKPQIQSLLFILYSSTDTSRADEKLSREVGADAFIPKFRGVEGILAVFREFSPRLPVEHLSGAGGSGELEVMKRYSEHFLGRMEEHISDLRQRTVEMEREIGERKHAQEQVERSRLALLSALEDQKLADDALRKSKAETERHLALLETTFDTLTEGVVICDMEGNVFSWNRAALAMHGYASLEECRRKLPEFQDTFEIVGQDGALVPFERWPLLRILRGETIRDWEALIRRKESGWERWFSYSGTLAKDKEGDPLLAVVRVADITERRRGEEALDRERALLRTLIDLLPDHIYVKDAQSRFLLANNGVAHAMGVAKPENLIGKTDKEFYPPKESAEFRSDEQSVMAGREMFNKEEPVANRDGSQRFILTTKVPLKDAAGNIIGLVGIGRDFTERKRAEAALAQERTLLRTLIDNLPGYIYIKDTQGRFLLASQPTFRLSGFTCESDILGKTVFDLFPPEVAGLYDADDRSVVATGEALVDHEEPYVTGDRRGWFSTTKVPLRDAGGNVTRLIGITLDITERKAAEEEIRRLADFPELNPNPVIELTAEASIQYHNAAAKVLARKLGFVHTGEMLPPDTAAIVRECLATSKSRVRLEITYGKRIVSWSFYPVPVRGIVHCYAADVTENRQLAEQLRQVQKMESVGQLAAGIAHDFNNLLTVVQGYTDIMRMGLADNSRSQFALALEEIAAASGRAANLTRQLLLFSRKQVAQRCLLDFNELTGNLTKMLGRILGEDIALRLDCRLGIPPVSADPGMIEQVITNLAVNARDAMPEGGRLEIATSVVELDAVQASRNPEAQPGRFVCLTVTDTGAGIPPEIMPRIFEPFFTTKEVGKGTGLGLATVYGIVMQHQGVLEVTSRPGEGACFQVFIPAASGAEAAAPGPAAPVADQGGSETILVVEDEPMLLTLMTTVLERAGYTVLTAVSGLAAQQVWKDHREKIDLLLTDLTMPDGVTGKQLAEILKAQTPSLRVIFMSGYSPDLRIGVDGIKEGLNYLQKPFVPSALLQAVRRQLDFRG